MVLIRLKIKLIDGNDKLVEIDDQKTLTEFRRSITEATTVPGETQRLIYRGRVLNDENKKLADYGLEDGMAIHLVKRQQPSENASPSRPNFSGEQTIRENDQVENGTYDELPPGPIFITQIIGVRPMPPGFDPSLHTGPHPPMNFVGNVMPPFRGPQQVGTSPPQNHQNNWTRRSNSNHQQIINSPARDRLDNSRRELRKLAWLVVMIRDQFLTELDTIFSGTYLRQGPSCPTAECLTISRVLEAMNAFDNFNVERMCNVITSTWDPELTSVIGQLDEWGTVDDEAHLQQLNPTLAMRHATSHDLRTILGMLSMIDTKINECLMTRYNHVLLFQHNLEPSSYKARMFNMFANAISRVQHLRAHIYFTISDLTIHAHHNEHNRLFPQ